jgi:hypothetical protein
MREKWRRNGKTVTNSERFSIISEVYNEFCVFRSKLIEKVHASFDRGQGSLKDDKID